MNIVQLTPGAGRMYCGGCFRDNALVAAWRRHGHEALMVPLYLPLNLEDEDQSRGVPIFFSGINVFLEQRLPWFAHAPHWLRRLLATPSLLRRVGQRAAKTRPAEVGELTLSMLQGEAGRQACEIAELTAWLAGHAHPQIVALSNALLIGMARGLKQRLQVPVVCFFQGEDHFLDGLPMPHRDQAWRILAERSRDVDLFIAPSAYFATRMRERLKLPEDRLEVVPNGIALTGFAPPEHPPRPPVLGFFARMCPEKGLDTVVEVFLILRRRGRVPEVRLHVGGSMGPADEPFVKRLRARLAERGLISACRFAPNLSRADKLAFYRSLSVLSVPALYGEAFGLYLLEAWASGVPVVQPRTASFPELIERTGGGLLCEPGNAVDLADKVEALLTDPDKAHQLGQRARGVVEREFDIDHMARRLVKRFEPLIARG